MRFAALLLLLLSAPGRQDSKVPVPPEEARSEAEKSVRDMYRDDYAVKTPAGQLKLARQLIEHGREKKDAPALRYVLFREACDLAVAAGAIDTLVRSLDELHSAFEIGGLALKESCHLRIEPNIKPEEVKRLAEADLNLVQEAVDQDQFGVATKISQASLALSRKSRDPALTARVETALKSVSETKAAFDKARKAEEALAATPEDPGANQIWGEWLCLWKGRWDKGLPFLAKGPDGPMRAAALREYSSSSELAQLVDVADGWWDLAEREKHPARKSQMLAHARSVYASALPKSTGLVRAKIGKRLEFDKDVPSKEAAGKEEEEALKAEAALAANPNDPAANLTLGKFLAFQKNEWSAAIPRLAKGSDPTLKSLAERELAAPGTGPEKAELGEAWSEAAKKLPALKKGLQDRAVTWYVQAWPSLEGASKDKVRDRLRRSFQTPGTVTKSPPKDWSTPTPEAKAGGSTGAPRTGRNCFQIAAAKIRPGPFVALSQSVAVRPLAAYELSCWVLTDDTDSADDKISALISTSDSRLLLQPSAIAPADQPWYKKIEVKFTAPETAAKMTVEFSVRSIKGAVFVDDVSLKQDGKELLKNGSFEQ